MTNLEIVKATNDLEIAFKQAKFDLLETFNFKMSDYSKIDKNLLKEKFKAIMIEELTRKEQKK